MKTAVPLDTLVLAEVFGPTFQGEGPSTGRRAAFIRTGGCNLACSWCDTPYTWDASRYDLRAEMRRTPVAEVVDQIAAMRPHVIIITGGEPLLHQEQPGWVALLAGLFTVALVEVETNGTIAPSRSTIAGVSRFVVSPKLAHSGDVEFARIAPKVLRIYAQLAPHRAMMKVVCETPEDVVEAVALAEQVNWPLEAVMVMPQATTSVGVLDGMRRLAPAALAAGVGMSTRLHTLIWEQERGR
jgi:7-carboxy-7-deazaguanine synthase